MPICPETCLRVIRLETSSPHYKFHGDDHKQGGMEIQSDMYPKSDQEEM